MKAITYRGPGNGPPSFEEVPPPRLQHPADAIVQISHTTICGTDLHILKGDLPEVTKGRVLGHEGVGTIVEIGPAVTGFAVGDRVLISCITACGRCEYCRREMFSHCASGGWALGHTADGTQAEFVRIPFADTSLYLAPPGIDDESLVMMSDVMPTAYECGVLSGRLRPGQTAAVIGAGPIGLGFILAARMFSPSQLIAIDKDDNRLEIARAMGATMVINNSNDKADAEVLEHTGGKGVDLAVEAVGIPSTFELCQAIVAPGGRIANIGVHGAPATLHLEKLWSHNITLTTRLVDTSSTTGLLQTLRSGAIQPGRLVTHRFAFSNFPEAYDVFSHASDRRAIKVLVSV